MDEIISPAITTETDFRPLKLPTIGGWLILIAVGLVLSLLQACGSAKKPVNENSNVSARTQKTTYWVIGMWTLIGTRYISEVCPLPIDDRESVAVAARAWGARHKGLMALEDSVYNFTSREEAEKFRREKGYIALDLNAGELTRYLCIGQPSLPPTDYWVVTMTNGEGHFISDVFPLPAYDSVNILAAADNWGYGKGFSTDVRGAYRFTKREDAENFRREKGLPELKLSISSLEKYLCALKPSSANPDKPSSPLTDDGASKPPEDKPIRNVTVRLKAEM